MKVALRRWSEADVDEVVRLTADPEIPRWTRVPEPNTAAQVRKALMSEPPEGELHLAITDGETGAVFGAVGLIRPVPTARRAEIGYWVGAEHRGRGIASAAVAVLAERAFAEHDYRRLELHVNPDNAASRRVAEKAGFSFEGILRCYEDMKGRLDDVAMYARIASAPHG